MRYTSDVFVVASGTSVPPTQPIGPVIAAGRIGDAHRNLGYESIAIDETGTAPVDMAAAAARAALERGAVPADRIDVHLHASVWFQGLDCWSPANYVANAAGCPQAAAFGIEQRSGGGLASLHLAAVQLAAGAAESALLTTGDRFAPPGVDRYNSYVQAIWGDGGTALVLSREQGFARVLASTVVGANQLERWDRGSTPFAVTPMTESPVAISRRFEQHAATPDAEQEAAVWAGAVLTTRDLVLADAGIGLSEISRAVLPFVHRGEGQGELHDLLGLTEQQTLWNDYGRHVGHLGAGDQFAGIDYLVSHKEISPGDRVLLFAVGVGFTISAAVIEILDLPGW